jgi:hypothetical protein
MTTSLYTIPLHPPVSHFPSNWGHPASLPEPFSELARSKYLAAWTTSTRCMWSPHLPPPRFTFGLEKASWCPALPSFPVRRSNSALAGAPCTGWQGLIHTPTSNHPLLTPTSAAAFSPTLGPWRLLCWRFRPPQGPCQLLPSPWTALIL